MCTAATYKTQDFYFGRTLDYEFSYGDEITVTPRNYPFHFRHMGEVTSHYAIIGMAHVAGDYPLYYDAVNEKGLAMAGLNFVGNAVYQEVEEGRENIAQFAVQFVGNPYVYGGTSLTNGADCSGFVMSVFKEFGYDLPRVAAAQYEASQKKDISQMETGDLVFYGAGGINHVALYIGDGKVVHALNSNKGIVITDYNYDTPVGVGTYVK